MVERTDRRVWTRNFAQIEVYGGGRFIHSRVRSYFPFSMSRETFRIPTLDNC